MKKPFNPGKTSFCAALMLLSIAYAGSASAQASAAGQPESNSYSVSRDCKSWITDKNSLEEALGTTPAKTSYAMKLDSNTLLFDAQTPKHAYIAYQEDGADKLEMHGLLPGYEYQLGPDSVSFYRYQPSADDRTILDGAPGYGALPLLAGKGKASSSIFLDETGSAASVLYLIDKVRYVQCEKQGCVYADGKQQISDKQQVRAAMAKLPKGMVADSLKLCQALKSVSEDKPLANPSLLGFCAMGPTPLQAKLAQNLQRMQASCADFNANLVPVVQGYLAK